MALTRKMLKAWGIEEDKIELIIDGHTDSLEAKENELKGTIAELQKKVEELESNTDSDGWQKKYEQQKNDYDDLKQQFDDYKDSISKKETLEKKRNAFKEVAKDSGLSDKGIEKALKYANYDSIELDKDGKIKNATDHIKSLKEEWSEYVVKEGTKGAETTNPPSNNGGKKYSSKSEIMAITDKNARLKAIAENRDLF